MRGIALVAVAYFAMTLGDVSGKWALPVAGLTGAMIGRGVAGATVVAIIARAGGPHGWRRLLPVRWKLVLFRSLLHSAVSLTWYAAWLTMSLADSYAIGFTAPLLMTVLAIPMLGERIRWRRAMSTAIGFGGVLIMLRPGGDLWTPVTAMLLVGIVGMAISRILTRVLSTTETPECLAFWLLAVHVPVGLAMLLVLPPPGFAWEAMLALGLLGASNGVAHWLQSRAYALAPISALAPYEYTTLIWGGLFGFLVFGDVPAWTTLAGAGVVAAAGLYNLNRERIRRREEAARARELSLEPNASSGARASVTAPAR